MQDHGIAERIDYVMTPQPPGHADRRALRLHFVRSRNLGYTAVSVAQHDDRLQAALRAGAGDTAQPGRHGCGGVR